MFGRRRPTEFAGNGEIDAVVRFGPDPAAQYRTAVVDQVYGMGLAGDIGHIPVGDPQSYKTGRNMPAQQVFVGVAQLTNLVNAKAGIGQAIPATKPNPGVVPLTAMQQQLMQMVGRG